MRAALRPYLAIVAARFRAVLQYRAAALAGLFTQSFFGAVRIMIFEAFYAASATAGASAPMQLGQAVGYVWLGQATLTMFPWNDDPELRETIRSGGVAYELCRPLDLYSLWYARAVALRTAPVLLRLVPMFVFAMLVLPAVGMASWRLAPPPSLAAGLAWLASIAGAVALSCAVTTLMSVTQLWNVGAQGGAVLISGLATLLGGLVIPLPLFPNWAQPIVYALPFAGVMDLPSRLFTGNLGPEMAPLVLAHQLGWTLILVAVGRFLLSRSLRRIVVQGG